MNSEVEEKEFETEIDSEADDAELSAKDDVVIEDAEPTDNVGDVSVEINVEELIAKIENEDSSDAARKKEIRRRLEEHAEGQALDDTYAFDLNEDL